MSSGSAPATDAAAVLALLSAAPLTIADGHHRYETALAFRDARHVRDRGRRGDRWTACR